MHQTRLGWSDLGSDRRHIAGHDDLVEPESWILPIRTEILLPASGAINLALDDFFRTVRRQVTITAGSEATEVIGLEAEKQ